MLCKGVRNHGLHNPQIFLRETTTFRNGNLITIVFVSNFGRNLGYVFATLSEVVMLIQISRV